MLAPSLLSVLFLQAANLPTTAPPHETRAQVARALSASIAKLSESSASERWPALRAALASAVGELGRESLIGAALERESAKAASEGVPSEGSLRRLEQFAEERARDLTFRPKVEAEQPPGFPKPSPVGEIVVLDYPSYRMARTDISASWLGREGRAFWRLFDHIQERSIAMTAPVEMAYSTDARGFQPRPLTMAFLYPNSNTGNLGRADGVEVLDVPAVRVVSMGLRGRAEAEVEHALAELRAWLARHPQWTPAGSPRVMGWNSPMVDRDKNFREVQIPIRLAETLAR
jgi:DNA gyrase inhibitor GyrI